MFIPLFIGFIHVYPMIFLGFQPSKVKVIQDFASILLVMSMDVYGSFELLQLKPFKPVING